MSSNLTLSDDEFVECQSFSNFSNYPRTQQSEAIASNDSSARTFDFTKSVVDSNLNVTVPSDNVLPLASKDSFRFVQQSRQNDSYSLDASHDDRSFMHINNTTRNVDDLEDMDRVLEQILPTQESVKNERTLEDGNRTINDIERKFPDATANVTFEQEAINTTTELTHGSIRQEVLTGSSSNQNQTFEQEIVIVKTEMTPENMSPVPDHRLAIPNILIQQATPENKPRDMSEEEVINECNNSSIAEIASRIKQEVEEMEVDEMEVDEGLMEEECMASQVPLTPTRDVKEISFGIQSLSISTDEEIKENIMRNIQSEIEEEFKMAELNEGTSQEQTLKDEHKSRFDGSNMPPFISRDSLANMFNNTFEQESVPADVTLNEESSTGMSPPEATVKGKQMNFMDAIENNFDVEFKVPSLPHFRKSGDVFTDVNGMDVFAGHKVPIDVKDEVFKSAGSSCKKKLFDFYA